MQDLKTCTTYLLPPTVPDSHQDELEGGHLDVKGPQDTRLVGIQHLALPAHTQEGQEWVLHGSVTSKHATAHAHTQVLLKVNHA